MRLGPRIESDVDLVSDTIGVRHLSVVAVTPPSPSSQSFERRWE